MRYVDIITRITYDTVGEQNIARGTTLLSKQERGVAAIINKQSALRHALSATYEAERKGLTGAIRLREQLSKSLDKNEAKLRKINIEASRAEKAAGMVSGGGGLLGGIGLLGGGAMAIAAAVGTASAAIVNITSEFEGYEAQLKTALGTTAAAEIALQQISEAAAKTPESVQSLTEAYVRLANTGLQPTIDELLKITDVSISQNKSVMAFSEAIIDAQTFEFERLKEFGILASKAGDKITFSFKGQEKQVAASALAVRDYLIGLGDMDGIAGAAEEKSKTLGGALSNLADSASRLAVSIGEILSPALTSIIRQFTDIISVADDFIGSTRDIFSAMNEAGQFDFSTGAGAIGDFFEGISNRIGLDLDSPDLGIMKKWYGLLSDFSGIDLDDITGGAIGLKNALSKIRELSKLEVEGDIFGVLSGRIAALEAFRSEVSAATETYSASQRAAIDVLINRQIADLQEAYFASVGIMQQRAEAERKDAAKRARIAAEQRSKEAAKAAEAEARRIADIRKSAAKDLLRDIGELEAEITDLQLGASPESIEKLTAQNKAEKERALANIEARRTELTEQKALNAELSQSLDTLEALTKRRFDIQLGLDIDKFRSDVDKAVSELNKLLGGGIEGARKERLDIDVTTNEGNIFGSYMARLAAASAASKSAISAIESDFEERSKEIEALQIDAESKGALLEKATVERNIRLSNQDIAASNARIKLYSDYISDILELDNQVVKSRELAQQVAYNNEIIALNKQYQEGIISKSEFEKSLTEIERAAAEKRLELQVSELSARKNIILGLLSNGSSLSQTLRDSLEQELEQTNADLSVAGANLSAPKTEGEDGFLARLLGVTDEESAVIVSLAKSVTAQVIKTIEAANQAEIARTDLLIKEQERRVSEAERIADDGNAEQLELERKRLDGLQKQREQYVQRQLELNAILAASSFASATASAIDGVAKAAEEGGVFAAITIPLYIASVGLGLASIVNMLSNAQSGIQGFYEGVVGIEQAGQPRRGRRDRRDTIPAFLAPGESVMTVRATEKYGDLLADMNAGRALSIPISEYSGTTNKIDLVLAAMQRQILSNNAASNVRIDKLETAIMKLTHHLNGGDVLMDGKKVGSVLDSRTRKANRITKLSR